MKTGLIIALDVKTHAEAVQIIDSLEGSADFYKVGGTLYLQEGNKIIETIQKKGARVFLDLKFFDIPNQVKETAYAAACLGVDFFTIHALGGKEMIKGALDGARTGMEKSGKSTTILGVTVLTSMNDTILQNELKVPLPVPDMVKHLAVQGFETGLRGFVCSPHEIGLIRSAVGSEPVIVTPGVRLAGDSVGDQKRVMTPAAARQAGASYIVMGRSIYEKANRVEAVQAILKELEG